MAPDHRAFARRRRRSEEQDQSSEIGHVAPTTDPTSPAIGTIDDLIIRSDLGTAV